MSSDAGSPTYETNKFNGRPVLRFTGSQNMSVSDLIGMKGGNEPFTVIAVANTSQTGAEGKILSFGDNASTAKESWSMGLGSGLAYRSEFLDATVRTTTTNIFASQGKTAVITMSYNGAGVRNVTNQLIYENGVKKPEPGTQSVSDGDAAIAETPMLHIGSRPDDSQKWKGYCRSGDLTRVLSNWERQQVEAYLAQKWLDEPYYKNCIDAENQGETADGIFTIDPDGYNGPRSPFSVTCDFAPYDNLVAWWKFDEASGTTAKDSAGSNDGTITNMAAANVGPGGVHPRGLKFDGTNDWVSTSYGGVSGSGARTVAAWVKTTYTGDWQTISGWGENTVGDDKFEFSIQQAGGYPHVGVNVGGTGGWKGGVTDVRDGRWHHVAVTYAAGTDLSAAKIYVDGIEEPSYSTLQAGSVNTATTNDVRIGTSLGGIGNFNGSIDDVRIYDTDLTAAQILELYKQGIP